TTPEGETAHRMTDAEIEAFVEGFVRAAAFAVEAGMDGVELHAAHGYLLQQSFSPWANRRDGVWGEPLKFLRAIIDGIRAATGPDAIIGLRICIDDMRPADKGGLGPDRLIELAAELAGRGGLDYINHSEGSKVTDYSHAIGSWRHPHGEFLHLTRR